MELIRRDYTANGGWETFLSYEDPQQGEEGGREGERLIFVQSLLTPASETSEIQLEEVGEGGREGEKLIYVPCRHSGWSPETEEVFTGDVPARVEGRRVHRQRASCVSYTVHRYQL